MAGGTQPSATQMLGTGLSGLNLSNAASSGNPLGITSASASLANSLGVPSSVTQPAQLGAQLGGLGVNLAGGNYLGALGSMLGLGGASGAIPSSVLQPAGLALSALIGNPLGMATNAYGVGKGLLNMIQGLNYNGSWTPSSQQTQQIGASNQQSENDVSDQVGQTIGDNQSLISAGQTPVDTSAALASLAQAPQLLPTSSASSGGTFTPAQLAQLGQNQTQNFDQSNLGFFNTGSYAGAPTDVMNQGEAETPTATLTQGAALQYAMQTALQQAQGNPQLMAQLRGLMG